jgi:hypothetical protein
LKIVKCPYIHPVCYIIKHCSYLGNRREYGLTVKKSREIDFVSIFRDWNLVYLNTQLKYLRRPTGVRDMETVTYGGEVVSLTHQLPFTTRKIPGTHFC